KGRCALALGDCGSLRNAVTIKHQELVRMQGQVTELAENMRQKDLMIEDLEQMAGSSNRAQQWTKERLEITEIMIQRDDAILKNGIYVELQEANKKLGELNAQRGGSMELVQSAPPPPHVTHAIPQPSGMKAIYRLPKAPALTTSVNNMMNTNQMGELYEEMREYKPWLRQIEEGQESIKGADENMGKFEPVPDNPPGIWDQHDGSVVGKASGDGQITRISRREHEKVVVKPWPRCHDLDVWHSGAVHAVCVAPGGPDRQACKIGWIQLRSLILTVTMNYLQIREISDSNPLAPSCRSRFRTWSRTLVKWPRKSRYTNQAEKSGARNEGKFEGSAALNVDLVIFKGREEEGDKKTYKELLDIMKRHIARVREDKSMAPPTTRPLENRALQLRSLLLQHLTRVMTRTLVAGQTSLPRYMQVQARPKDEGKGSSTFNAKKVRMKSDEDLEEDLRAELFEVGDLIPYVYLRHEECRPITDKEAKMVAKILGLMKAKKKKKLKSSDTAKKIENQEDEFDRCMREFEEKIGTTYRVGLDGSKEIRGSPRPKGDYTPKGWRALPLKERDVIIRREKLREEPKWEEHFYDFNIGKIAEHDRHEEHKYPDRTNAVNVDAVDGAARVIDVVVMTHLKARYKSFYTSWSTWMRQSTRRVINQGTIHEFDSYYPHLGTDKHGLLKPRREEDMKAWFEKKKSSEGEVGGRNEEAYLRGTIGTRIMCRLMKHLVETGMKPASFTTMVADNPDMRITYTSHAVIKKVRTYSGSLTLANQDLLLPDQLLEQHEAKQQAAIKSERQMTAQTAHLDQEEKGAALWHWVTADPYGNFIIKDIR
ncbi:unnamed protein product, partial [Cladocopium goreaui]